MAVNKSKTSRQFRNEGSAPPSKQPVTPEQAFETADRKVAKLHAGLFRRLAEYDRQKDDRNK